MSPRLAELYEWHHDINQYLFHGKLMSIRILLETRNGSVDGVYMYHVKKGMPDQDRLDEATITIHKDSERLGTLIHEMIHQYQAEVLKVTTDHGAVFNSIARHAEREYGVKVR